MHRGARRAAAETPNVKRPLAAPSRPLAVPAMLALALATTGCSTLSDILAGDKVDYRTGAAQTKPLDVPPDLTQLSRDRRASQAQAGGTVSASSLATDEPVSTDSQRSRSENNCFLVCNLVRDN